MSFHSFRTLHQTLRLGVLASLFPIIQARAQFYQPIAIDASLLKFFGENTAFAAKAEFITQTDGKPDVMPVKIAILGNMARVETPNAIVWIAQGPPVCPLRLDVLGSDGRTNCVLAIGDVQPGKVDAKLFEPPRGFKKCETQDALMQVIIEHWPKEKNQ